MRLLLKAISWIAVPLQFFFNSNQFRVHPQAHIRMLRRLTLTRMHSHCHEGPQEEEEEEECIETQEGRFQDEL